MNRSDLIDAVQFLTNVDRDEANELANSILGDAVIPACTGMTREQCHKFFEELAAS